MSYIPALMRRGGGKNRRGGKNAMLRREPSVYDPSRSLHQKFFFGLANLAGHCRAFGPLGRSSNPPARELKLYPTIVCSIA
jgi:hypothetical protein